MDFVSATVWTLHVVFAAFWTGSVLFVAATVIPAGATGDIGSDALSSIIGRLRTVTRVSAFVSFLTGGYMAGATYTVEQLTGTGRGHLVLTMLVLWFVLAGLVEAGSSKLRSGIDAGKLREPVRNSRSLFLAAAAVSILLLITGGVLASNAVA
ncbi:transporter [Halopenitus sp. H-Gu1]|uniref:transporter n=1 Tax=Halopenitus sp. H-Gu1 TaxID=3242697 RepID=UPI00359D7B60